MDCKPSKFAFEIEPCDRKDIDLAILKFMKHASQCNERRQRLTLTNSFTILLN